MDESGHDHRNCPYEVRGGIAIQAERIWPFIRAMVSLEESCFGDLLHKYGLEIKGHRLLDKDRFKWAYQKPWYDDALRRSNCLSFLKKKINRQPIRDFEFASYGQACIMMARGIFHLLLDHDAVVFAAVIDRGVRKPATYRANEYLRKDQVFLLERYFNFLVEKGEQGLLVMDETEKTDDRRFVGRLQRYYTRTNTGRIRSEMVIPSPFFVSSDMVYPIQAADVCIYSINWGFRIPNGMNSAAREEVRSETEAWLVRLQFSGEGRGQDGQMHHQHGIIYVPDPFEGR